MHVAIIGLGLIGGSLGMALKAAGGHVVVGWDPQAATRALALERGAIDRKAPTLEAAVEAAHLVVIATPVLAMRAVLAALAPALSPGAVVTDVGSTKRQVIDWARDLLPRTNPFVGGHPMAGSEQVGVAHARPDLFAGATYCLCPEPDTPPGAIARVEHLVEAARARVVHLPDADAHDALVAKVSHVPMLASAALARITTKDGDWDALSLFAATGYRDATRLASGDPAMHRDICVTNADAIRPLLLALSDALREVADQLDDPGAIGEWLQGSKAGRDHWVARAAALRAEPQGPPVTGAPPPRL